MSPEPVSATLDLDAIKARCEAAAPGPWRTGHDAYDACRIEGPTMTIYDEGGHTAADAAFIAHARQDVPALVAEVERLRAAGDALLSYIDRPEACQAEIAAWQALTDAPSL